MRLIVATCCICWLLLSAVGLRCPASAVLPSVGAMLANAEATRTDLMQQSDHHRRVERAKKAEAEDRQMAALGLPETASRNYDYLALIMLGASVVVLAVVTRRKRRVRSRL